MTTRRQYREIQRAKTLDMSKTVSRPSLLTAVYSLVLAVGWILFDEGMQPPEIDWLTYVGIALMAFGGGGILSQAVHVGLFRSFLVSVSRIINEYEDSDDTEDGHRDIPATINGDPLAQNFVISRNPKRIPGSRVVVSGDLLVSFCDQLNKGQDGKITRPEGVSGQYFQNIREAMRDSDPQLLIFSEGSTGFLTVDGERFVRNS